MLKSFFLDSTEYNSGYRVIVDAFVGLSNKPMAIGGTAVKIL